MNASTPYGSAGPMWQAVLPTLLIAVLPACAAPTNEAAEPELGSVVVTRWNDSTELFLEYPHRVAGAATGNWAVHLSSMKDFEPIRSGTLTVRFRNASGVAETFTVEGVLRDGIFVVDPVIDQPGEYEVELSLESPQVTSRHVLERVVVFASEAEAPRAVEEEEAGGIGFLKEQQWQIPFAVHAAEEAAVQRTVSAPGEVVPPDGALVQVSAPVDGIAAAAENRDAPSVGQRVRPGEVLAVLAPTTDEGGFAETRARVERLEREVARAERLYEVGAVPEKRLEEARHDLEVARAQARAIGGSGTDGAYQLRLEAPIAGVIAERRFIPGGRVRAGDLLFTVVDPRAAWLRVQVPVSEADRILADAPATFTVEGGGGPHPTGRLVSVGRVLSPGTRTVPVVFEVAESGTRFTFGQLAQVAVPVGGKVTGVAIPNGAIVDDNGTPVAYVQLGGETFERRALVLGVSDGVRTHVIDGITAGEMVVTTGAYQVRLASASGGEFAGGHTH